MKDDKFWLALGKNPKFGAVSFRSILETKVPFSEIYSMKKNELHRLGLPPRVVTEILFCQENIIPENVVEDLAKREIKYIFVTDEKYPALLKEIFDPPAILYYKGMIEPDSFNLAIVGSRRLTSYGETVTTEIAKFLAHQGVTIVSGMAIGVDTIAHTAALSSGGKTYAVVGCGMDQIYPSCNVDLARGIEENGAIISEFPIGVKPFRYNFPLRNRTISGLSEGTIVTEAAVRSGSLITAMHALEQNRDVFAVPGPIFNLNSQGPNNLIKMGAKIVTKPSDILDELGVAVKDKPKSLPKAESVEEAKIIDVLKEEPRHIDVIIKQSGLDQAKITSVLTLMEISGKIKHIGGMNYKLNS